MNKIVETFRYRKGKIILPFMLMGLFGLTIEVCFRAILGAMVGYDGFSYISLMGYTSIWMIIVYGFGGLTLCLLNEIPKFYNAKMIWQMLMGGLSIIIVELIFGIIFNIGFGLNLWHYTTLDFLNQISVMHSTLWILATPFFIWVCDFIGWALYRENEEWKYRWFQNYIDIFRGR